MTACHRAEVKASRDWQGAEVGVGGWCHYEGVAGGTRC